MKKLGQIKDTKSYKKVDFLEYMNTQDLTKQERAMYGYLISRIDDIGYTFRSIMRITKDFNPRYNPENEDDLKILKNKARSTRRIIKSLEIKGLLKREAFYDKLENYIEEDLKRTYLANNGRQGSNNIHLTHPEDHKTWLKDQNKPKIIINTDFINRKVEITVDTRKKAWESLTNSQKASIIAKNKARIFDNFRKNERYDITGKLIYDNWYFKTHTEKQQFKNAIKSLNNSLTYEEIEQYFNEFIDYYLEKTRCSMHLPKKKQEYIDLIKESPIFDKLPKEPLINTPKIDLNALGSTKEDKVAQVTTETKNKAKKGKNKQKKRHKNKPKQKIDKKTIKNLVKLYKKDNNVQNNNKIAKTSENIYVKQKKERGVSYKDINGNASFAFFSIPPP